MRKKLITSKSTKPNTQSIPDFRYRMRGYFTGSILSLGILTSMGQLHAQEDISLIQQEINRRATNVNEAQKLLKKGDASYNAGNFKDAVVLYRKAFDLIPEAGMTHELRFAAGDRYAQAAVEYGKVLARTGQYKVAREHLNDVLNKDVAPGNAGAMKMLAKLDDPMRYSPTLTPEHVRDIEQVAHWLRKAESYFLQAQYDEALVAYEEVTRVDPSNKAARLGMERVIQSVRSYGITARDHRRSEALNEINELWELKVPPVDDFSIVRVSDSPGFNDRLQNVRGSKLKQIMVPSVDLEDVSFSEAIRMVRVWARELDTTELDPEKKGVNFVSRLGDEQSGFKKKLEESRINLSLKNVPLSVVLDYITQQSGTYWRQEQFAVVIRPRGANTAELESRTFRVPVGFMDEDKEEAADDVFGNAPALQAKTGVIDFFKKLGIAFPTGSTAFYNKSNNTLRVTNAPLELDAIETFIRAKSLSESVMVVIKTSIIEINETRLNELGYDWLLDPTYVKNNTFLTGGTQGNGGAVGPVPSFVGGRTVSGDGITSGNRSGDTMFANNSIDSRIAGINTPLQNRAAAPLSVTSQINDATFQTIMRALNQKTAESTLYQSTTVSLAGQRVELSSGNEMIYPTEYEPGELPDSGLGNPPLDLIVGVGRAQPGTPTHPTAFETRQLGYQMQLEPAVSDNRHIINLQLNPQITVFEGFVNYGNPLNTAVIDLITGLPVAQESIVNDVLMPVFKTTRLNTTVSVQDGSTIVVGGLIEQRIENVEDKVPMLGDLPLVGRFFQSRGLKSTKRAVIMFVKVELVDPTGHAWRDR